jgi:hypothetical protein
MDQVSSIKYTNIFHCMTLQNLTKIWIFGLKTNHLATLVVRRRTTRCDTVRIVQNFGRMVSYDADSVTRWVCEKIAKNVAQPIIYQN